MAALLRDNEEYVRVYATNALWQVNGRADQVVPTLVDSLKGAKNDSRRGTAAGYLADMGPAAKDAVRALIEALKDEWLYNRMSAAHPLVKAPPLGSPWFVAGGPSAGGFVRRDGRLGWWS